MSQSYGNREWRRRYRYDGWFYGQEYAHIRRHTNRCHRYTVRRLLRAAPDWDALNLPPPPKTGGWLTW